LFRIDELGHAGGQGASDFGVSFRPTVELPGDHLHAFDCGGAGRRGVGLILSRDLARNEGSGCAKAYDDSKEHAIN